jgi:tRNA pseudouridine38-40 synthase
MPTYRLLIEYEGTRYSGWQTQSNTPKTIQGILLRAAGQVFRDAEIGGSGRTDAGVHAAGQVAHLRIRPDAHPREIARKLNDLLPHDITVVDVRKAPDEFHARHDAESRVYLYQIARRRTAFAKSFVWWVKDDLDLALMQRAAVSIAGMHDFAAFSDRRAKTESTSVLVDLVQLDTDGPMILFRVGASHFLWKMVRKLTAALVEVGRGTLAPEAFAALLVPGGEPFHPSAPPSGLFLEAVRYPGEEFDRPLEPIIPIHRPFAPGSDRWKKTSRR